MILSIILLIILMIIIFVNFHPVFGSKPNKEMIDELKNSPHYFYGKFQNLIPTKMDFNKNEKYSSSFIAKSSSAKTPNYSLPSIAFNRNKFEETNFNTVTWFGHSTILLKLENKTLLIDPVFDRASPLSKLIGPKPFKYENNISANDLPQKIDILIITHDHYDHLDYNTIKKIKKNVNRFIVPLGVKAHLKKWGVANNKIIQFDWYDTNTVAGIEFIFTPTRHFSGRALRDRFATLWGGWIIKSKQNNLYISGDGGYSKEFKNIGKKYGPFDLIFIENGAYNPRWHNVHLFPEQSVQASIDVNAKLALPIHWGKYSLSSHSWTEPIERFTLEAEKKNLQIITPLIGETFNLNENFPKSHWWETNE